MAAEADGVVEPEEVACEADPPDWSMVVVEVAAPVGMAVIDDAEEEEEEEAGL